MTRIGIRLAVVLMVGLPAAAAAQGSVAGQWATEFETGVRNVNGEVTAAGKGHATIELTAKGDSIKGTFTIIPSGDGAAPPATHLAGIRTGGKLELRSDPSERHLQLNGDDRTVMMASVYSLELKGDTLSGTTHVHAMDGSLDGPDRPFLATRVKK